MSHVTEFSGAVCGSVLGCSPVLPVILTVELVTFFKKSDLGHGEVRVFVILVFISQLH